MKADVRNLAASFVFVLSVLLLCACGFNQSSYTYFDDALLVGRWAFSSFELENPDEYEHHIAVEFFDDYTGVFTKQRGTNDRHFTWNIFEVQWPDGRRAFHLQISPAVNFRGMYRFEIYEDTLTMTEIVSRNTTIYTR